MVGVVVVGGESKTSSLVVSEKAIWLSSKEMTTEDKRDLCRLKSLD